MPGSLIFLVSKSRTLLSKTPELGRVHFCSLSVIAIKVNISVYRIVFNILCCLKVKTTKTVLLIKRDELQQGQFSFFSNGIFKVTLDILTQYLNQFEICNYAHSVSCTLEKDFPREIMKFIRVIIILVHG